ncbi:MAG: hypothetical protein ACM3Q2_14875, partial [Syntrophothermus sp.]
MSIKTKYPALHKTIMKVMRMGLILLSGFLAILLILTAVILIYSPGTPEQFTDKSGNVITGSISEKTFVTVGGIKQGMFIRGRNINNPVLLYVHGGPAF